MKTIHKACLLKFNNNCKEHRDAYQEIKGYNFNTDIETIKCLLESTDFRGGVIFNEDDLDHFIVEGTFMVGIEFEDEMLDDWKYLFDAYNVYFSNSSDIYNKDDKLTTVWRNIMIHAYPDSTYTKDLKIYIEEERKQSLAETNAKFDQELEDIK